jgi:hypothetical protein
MAPARGPESRPFPDRGRFHLRARWLAAEQQPGPAGTADHTSILATIELKWNLPALTRRDAQASPLTDFIDLSQPPHFATPAPLPRPTIWPLRGRR